MVDLCVVLGQVIVSLTKAVLCTERAVLIIAQAPSELTTVLDRRNVFIALLAAGPQYLTQTLKKGKIYLVHHLRAQFLVVEKAPGHIQSREAERAECQSSAFLFYSAREMTPRVVFRVDCSFSAELL